MAKNRTIGTVKGRSAKSGQFTIGREAFTKVSRVEGIVLSRGLKDDLRRLGGASPEKRRTALAHKYGKK
jgi:hypothetical protein